MVVSILGGREISARRIAVSRFGLACCPVGFASDSQVLPS